MAQIGDGASISDSKPAGRLVACEAGLESTLG
jgi:hypothetical protein